MSSKTTLPDWKRIDDVVEGCGVDGGDDDDVLSHALTEAMASKHCDAEVMQASWWYQEKNPEFSS